MNENVDPANYRRIERALAFLELNFRERPSLDAIAASAGLSKYHFQRLFKNFAGITPTQFMHFLTVEYAKSCLADSQSLLHSASDVGLSGTGRLHDLFVNIEAMTPGEFKNRGKDVLISYGIHETLFGTTFVAISQRGICALRFMVLKADEKLLVKDLQTELPHAVVEKNIDLTQRLVREIFSDNLQKRKFTLWVKGTNLQVKVWQALLSIPEGSLVSYENMAAIVGRPTATRSVASAIAKNPIAYLIPCHRVISKSGIIHQYRWGYLRKKIILGYEAAKIAKEKE